MFLRFSHFKAVSDAMYAILKYEFALFFVLKPSRCAETMCAINLSIFTLFSIVQYFELDYYRSRCAKTMCAINFALFAQFSILYYLHYFQFLIIFTIFNFALFALFSILHYFYYFQFCIICTIFNFAQFCTIFNLALFALFSILQNFAPFSILHYFDWIETGVQIPCVLPSILHQLMIIILQVLCSALLCF